MRKASCKRVFFECLEPRLLPASQILGTVWNDLDGDTGRDAGEPVLADWIVFLDQNNNGTREETEPLSVTDESGGYSFAGLAAGVYTVAEELQDGWKQTFPTGNSGAPSEFQIDVRFTDNSLSASQQAIFSQAAARWSEIITGDIPDVNVPGIGLIDDVIIDAAALAIDGRGGTLAQAGPTRTRPISSLPSTGIMQFDTADVDSLETSGELLQVIAHEMGHVLGFGTIWTDLGVISGFGSSNPRFTGAQATFEYNSIFGLAEPSVPVENTGGGGTRDAHWRESVFSNELMTGFLNRSTFNPISRVTAASFADLGYVVDLSAADAYSPPSNLHASSASSLVSGGLLSLTGLARTEGKLVATAVQAAALSAGPGTYTVTVGDNDVVTGRDFGNKLLTGTAVVSGIVWNDLDEDGQRDGGEPGLQDWMVFLDVNANNQHDTGEPIRTTDSTGGYSFANLDAGTYRVRGLAQPGFAFTFPVGGLHFVSLSEGQDRAGIDFGAAVVTEATVTVDLLDGSLQVAEGGSFDRFTVALGVAPTSDVAVALLGGAQLTARSEAGGSSILLFTPTNWSQPQAIRVFAVDDSENEQNPHIAEVFLSASSADNRYDGLTALAPVSIADNDQPSPPHVVGLAVHGQHWSAPFGDQDIPVGSGIQLFSLPWMGLDQIMVRFDQDVVIAREDFLLTGEKGAIHPLAGGELGLRYEPQSFMAVFTLAEPLGADRLELSIASGAAGVRNRTEEWLDGEWDNPTAATDLSSSSFPSGDGAAGGNFVFRFIVAPGDVSGEGVVDTVDVLFVRLHLGASTNQPSEEQRFDVDGSGATNIIDMLLVKIQLGVGVVSLAAPARSTAFFKSKPEWAHEQALPIADAVDEVFSKNPGFWFATGQRRGVR